MAPPNELYKLGVLTFTLLLVLLILAWTAVALRMWVRLTITKSPGWDDATMLMALVRIPAMWKCLSHNFPVSLHVLLRLHIDDYREEQSIAPIY